MKIPRIAPEASGCCALLTWPSTSHRKWTAQRCQGQPSTCATAFFKPT
jgi:hypothetical protein